jgi:hypothetical protein
MHGDKWKQEHLPIFAFDPKLPANRLGLAEWLFDQPIHSLQSFVNQMWQEFFGRGIVKLPVILNGRNCLESCFIDWLAADFGAWLGYQEIG